jgi:hypothetical protein
VAVGHEEGGGLERAHEALAEDVGQLGPPDGFQRARHPLHLVPHRQRHQVVSVDASAARTTTTIVPFVSALPLRLLSLEQIGVQQRLEPLSLALCDVDSSAACKPPRSLCTDKKLRYLFLFKIKIKNKYKNQFWGNLEF